MKYAGESCSKCRALLAVEVRDDEGTPIRSALCLHGLWGWTSLEPTEKLTEHLKSAVGCAGYWPLREHSEHGTGNANANAPAFVVEAFERAMQKLGLPLWPHQTSSPN